ncbi:hypothetical protein [Demequina sp. NBRC 110054]|uniref:hypothetical protein n=1 Tax=Demequina sp. NBRC 110054 TaxID=1570343 RepID=UPI000A027BEB|nr:hypothetical protein [Demequina sp. NBRC 110054]
MLELVLASLGLGFVSDRLERRVVLARIRRLQDQGILVCAVRGLDSDLGRFGRQWLSSEWRVAPGRVHVGSTTIVVESVEAGAREGSTNEFMLPLSLDAVVLTARGPGPTVEIAMAAESEQWFRDTVAIGGVVNEISK